MKKVLLATLVLGAGIIGYWLLSPLWRVERVDEKAPEPSMVVPSTETSQSAELFTGKFVGFDRLHQGSGTANILQVDNKTYIRFESDFTVSNGPDLVVGFGKDGVYRSGSEVGALKGNVGAQNYELPNGFDKDRYNEVYVWCRAFSVPFAKAQLVPAS